LSASAFHAPIPGYLDRAAGGYQVSLRVPRRLKVERVWVRSEPDNEEVLSPLSPACEDALSVTWRGELVLNPASDVTVYCFKLLVAGTQLWIDALGSAPYLPQRATHFRINPYDQPPPWVCSQVFYQIFPDRFCDGDPSTNVRSGEYLYEGKPVIAKRWGELPTKGQGAREFYGGDLAGILAKLPYLQDLGVTALYLNPIFTSPSSHKYDTVDYTQIDPHLGSNALFAELCAELRRRGMRIILDAVVNHTSERHPWFDRYGEHATPGAYQSAASPTREFYTFADPADPEAYAAWHSVKTLPVLNYASTELQREIYAGPHAVLRLWLRPPYSIDGWRFDVIHMLGEGAGARNNASYVRHFRQAVRQENPEAYVLGEHFFEASPWLQGDQEDGAMNYWGFTLPVWAFLAGTDVRGHTVRITAADLRWLLARARAAIPFANQLAQFNLLDSHDTPRLLTLLGGDKALYKAAVTLLLSYIGVPCIYYGDEIGLEGQGDPDCRRCFPWDTAAWDHDLRRHLQRLIALRKARPALQRGALIDLYAKGDVFAFGRLLADEILVTALNRGAQARVALPLEAVFITRGQAIDLLSQETFPIRRGRLVLPLPARSARLLALQW
jgi:alpha-glucosidase